MYAHNLCIVPTVIWICKLSTDIHFNFYQLGKSISAQYNFKMEKKLFIRLIIYQIFSHSVHKGNASFSLCFMELLQGTKVKVSWIHVIRLVNLKVKTVTIVYQFSHYCLMFFSPLMSNHAEKSSVEDRLKRNKYKLQRGSGDMDRGFLKKWCNQQWKSLHVYVFVDWFFSLMGIVIFQHSLNYHKL